MYGQEVKFIFVTWNVIHVCPLCRHACKYYTAIRQGLIDIMHSFHKRDFLNYASQVMLALICTCTSLIMSFPYTCVCAWTWVCTCVCVCICVHVRVCVCVCVCHEFKLLTRALLLWFWASYFKPITSAYLHVTVNLIGIWLRLGWQNGIPLRVSWSDRFQVGLRVPTPHQWYCQ